MKITRTKHTSDHWVFYLEDGSKFSVGRLKQLADGTTEGVEFEHEAIAIVEQNLHAAVDPASATFEVVVFQTA